MDIFEEGGEYSQSAHWGWQKDIKSSLIGIKVGYKSAADILVDTVLNGVSEKGRETLFFPLLFLYRHSIECSLKLIYYRTFNCSKCGHDLDKLWDLVNSDVIGAFTISDIVKEDTNESVKIEKMKFENQDLQRVGEIIHCLMNVDQEDDEHSGNNSADHSAEVWRYMADRNENMFYQRNHVANYGVIKENMDFVYDYLDFVFDEIDRRL